MTRATLQQALDALESKDIGNWDWSFLCGKLRAELAKPDLADLVKKVHAAKGRYHSQLAMCDLYEACGLPCVRPTKDGK